MTETKPVAITPLGDRILLKAIAVDEKTEGGIILVQTAQEKPTTAEVLAVGQGALLQDGTRVAPLVKPGDIVIYARYSCVDHKQAGVDYLIAREGDLLAVIG